MKKFLVIILTLALVLSLAFSLVACNNNNDNTNSNTNNNTNNDEKKPYKITVNYSDAVVLATLKAKLVKMDGSDACDYVALDNGSATFDVEDGVYIVNLTSTLEGVLDNFEYSQITLTPMVREGVIELTEKQNTSIDDGKVECTFTFVDSKNNAISGLMVQMCSIKDNVCFNPKTTNENGVVTFSLDVGSYSLHILNVQETSFDFDEQIVNLSNDNKEFTITLLQKNSTEPVTYTVNVSCEDELTLSTLTVKLINQNGQETEALALQNGVASFELAQGTYTVVIESAFPSIWDILEAHDASGRNFTLNQNNTVGNYSVGPKTKEIEYKLTVLIGNELSSKPAANVNVVITSTNNASKTVTTDSKGIATVKLEAGSYTVDIDVSGNQNQYFNRQTIYVSKDNTQSTVYVENACTYSVKLKDQDGKSISNVKVVFVMQDENRQFLLDAYTDTNGTAKVTGPYATYVINIPELDNDYHYDHLFVDNYEPSTTIVATRRGFDSSSRIEILENVETTITLSSKTPFLWYEFNPTRPAIYSIESFGNQDTSCVHYHGTAGFILPSAIIDCPVDKQDKSEDDKNFYIQFRIEPYEIEEGSFNIFAFKIGANLQEGDDEVSFTVKITYISEIVEKVIPITNVQATEIKAAIEQPQDTTFEWIPFGQGYTVEFNKEDGLFHLNGVDGPVVLVAISNKKGITPRAMDCDFIKGYYESGYSSLSQSDGETYSYDYFDMISAYAQASSALGLTPLTNELKFFLQNYALLQGVYAIMNWDINGVEGDNLYYFACGYFKNTYMAFPDVGEGSEEEPFVFVPGSYKFEMSANTTYNCIFQPRTINEFIITVEGATLLGVEDGDPCIIDNFQTFQLKATKNTQVILTIVAVDDIPVEEGGFLKLGDSKVNAKYSGVKYKFKAEEDGDYTFTVVGDALLIKETEFGSELISGETLTLQAGEVVTFICCSMGGDITCTVNIEKAE